MTRVKICGITSAEDAAAAVDAGADALGLVFVPGTPRHVAPDLAAGILEAVPPLVATVGVFVDHPLEEVLRIVSVLGLHAVQLHGQEPAAYSRRIPVPVIRAVRVRDAASLRSLETYPAHAFLLDAYVEGLPGGTGTPISLDLARQAKGRKPVILSGGLRPETVSQAVRLVRPYGVDVSSGVEASPGRKDHAKVREFIVNVRQADLG
ncbi:MAG: trpF [candidate division NC10 bacterium]|jgi:phosphoribosylanthranilate isomerase|nr:trpF [candidate division NC10 bacterium]